MNTSHITHGAQLLIVGYSQHKGKLVTVVDNFNFPNQEYFKCLLPDGKPIRLKGTSLAPPSQKTLKEQGMFNIDEYKSCGIICADGNPQVNTTNGIRVVKVPKTAPKRAL